MPPLPTYEGGGASVLTTVQNWYHSLPLATKSTFTTCTAIYVFQLLTGYDQFGLVCLSLREALWHMQVYRLLTSVLVHAGLLHVAFNMLAFVPMGASLERLIGTVQFGYLILLFTVLEGVLYLAASFALEASHVVPGVANHCAIGFSGVIFGLIVVDNAQSSATHRSIFGLFSVPAPYYPWALLVFWQMLMPGASFLGHLSGALSGQLWVWGYLKPFQLSRTAAAWLESHWPLASFCVPRPSFIMMPGAVLPYTQVDTAPRGAAAGGHGAAGFGPDMRQLWQRWAGRRGADGDVEAAGSGAGSSSSGGQQESSSSNSNNKFPGTARVLGSAVTVPTGAPTSAAALAAEVRAGRAAKSGAGGGSG